VLVNQNGTVNSRNYYYPYGGNRGGAFSGLTTKRFTGQYHEQGLPGGEGLSYYNARWYDARIAVFISADILVPNPLSPQMLNRFAYVSANPLKFIDPSGYAQTCDDGGSACVGPRAIVTPAVQRYRAWSYAWAQTRQATTRPASRPKPPQVYSPARRVVKPPSLMTRSPSASSGGGASRFGPRYSPRASAAQAYTLVFNWFSQSGPEAYTFGPDDDLTQDVMYDPGLQQFRQKWAASGYQLPFSQRHTADDRTGSHLLLRIVKGLWVLEREHILQPGLVLAGFGSRTPDGPIDAVGGTIGSLDLISVTAAGEGLVQFTVTNEMGWASGTRLPGTDMSFIPNQSRSDGMLGGTITQSFQWWESDPLRR
jgi:RHS repeat-associated protein